MKIFTIGVYNSTQEEFFKKMTDNCIDHFCDIRQRRGVRGSQYSFVNSLRLQAKLKELGIEYLYVKELAPTTEIRDLQRAEDKRVGEHKRDRNCLGEVFANEYRKQILSRFDLDSLVAELESRCAKNVVFFCVEEKATACHRSLVALEIKQRYGYEVANL